MIETVPPALVFILGALPIPLFGEKMKSVYMTALPMAVMAILWLTPEGHHWNFGFLDRELTLFRVDRLSLVFGWIFAIVSLLGVVYALKVRDDLQHAAAFVYAGGAMGVTFSGDLISLYFFWEIMAAASVVLILAARSKGSRACAFRYFSWHFFGGLCLLAGIVLYAETRGTVRFDYIGLTDTAAWLIFIGFCLNAAVFPFHAWLPDAYPRATVTGAVFMSALTTKSAVYILARTFPGAEILVWAGAFMTCFPIFYAVIVNDMRRVLAYSLINQVGFMLCGIGIGSQLAINGAVSHAFCHIVYKALLFMSTGAVLRQTGKIRGTDLGGLYKTMPFTAICCMIGAASISAFPLFSGFVSKSMTVTAVAEQHRTVVWLMLLFASAGVFHHAGIKVPYFIFFGHDSRIRAKEPPLNMRVAMGAAAFICVFLGVFPAPLYAILPFPVDYEPYSAFHVIGMLELLMFGALAFTLLILSGHYPAERRAVNLDTDWFVRIPGRAFVRFCKTTFKNAGVSAEKVLMKLIAVARRSPKNAVSAENAMDMVFHAKIASTPEFLHDRVKGMRTESNRLFWNMIYILGPFVAVFLAILASGG